MYLLSQLQDLVNKQIAESDFNFSASELYDPVKYIMSLGGKRLRPNLLLMSCNLFKGPILDALPVAVGIELFHNFTLMHDDIMDKAPIRRGKPTVHAKWGESSAILSGDAMLIEAYKLISTVDMAALRDVLKVFNETAISVCEGQQADMRFEESNHVTINDYLDMIRLKTAVLIAGSLKIGAIIANATPENADLIYSFGENLGISFQLQDDILDIYGNPEKFGKRVGGDIISNKKTFLRLKAMELAEGLDLEELMYWSEYEGDDQDAKVKEVIALYNRLGIREIAEKEMSKFAELALLDLREIKADEERKDVLTSFADSLLIREA